MCGIVGIVNITGGNDIKRELLVKMNDLQTHRGPDEEGIHIEPGVALGHRRLSIIDLSSGQQPLFNEDGSVVVVYNGEIYNFPQLRTELESHGHIFKTHCDTEVIVHGWEQWGESCVEKFRGMFAFAIWDRNKKSVFLARDRLGVKPLYYAELSGGQLIFSSEFKSLLAHPGLSRETDPTAIEEYFSLGYVPEPKTIIKGAKKLPPGYTLTAQIGKKNYRLKQYWDVPFKLDEPATEQEIAEELIIRLREAVKIRMIAEVPLGAFLSGGVDSSAVVAMMAQLSNNPVNTCSISFDDPRYNESEYAAVVADRYKTSHDLQQVKVDDFDLIDRLAGLYDEPFADSSAIPTYRVCQLARKKVTVALSGDGGDENFAGYRRYRWHLNEERVRNVIPFRIRRPLFGILGKIYPKADWAPKLLRAKSTFEGMARDSIEGYFHSVSVMGDPLREQLYSKKIKSELQGYHAIEVFRYHEKKSPTLDPMSLVQYIDMKTYLVGDILTKVDRASMAHSLEVRVPILDHKLVEWVSGLNPSMKLRGREGKYIFKKSLEKYLPEEILYRKKMGFAVPLAQWFRGPLRQKVKSALFSPILEETGYFRKEFLQKLYDQHVSGRRDYSSSIWTIMMFEKYIAGLSQR